MTNAESNINPSDSEVLEKLASSSNAVSNRITEGLETTNHVFHDAKSYEIWREQQRCAKMDVPADPTIAVAKDKLLEVLPTGTVQVTISGQSLTAWVVPRERWQPSLSVSNPDQDIDWDKQILICVPDDLPRYGWDAYAVGEGNRACGHDLQESLIAEYSQLQKDEPDRMQQITYLRLRCEELEREIETAKHGGNEVLFEQLSEAHDRFDAIREGLEAESSS